MQVGTSGFMRAVDVPAERKLTSVSSGGLVHRRTIANCVSARRWGRPSAVPERPDNSRLGRFGNFRSRPRTFCPESLRHDAASYTLSG